MVTQTTTTGLVPTSRFSSEEPSKTVNTHFKFKNGWTVSFTKKVGVGGGMSIHANETTAEVAVFDKNDQFVPFKDGEQVKGYVDADTLLEIMKWAASQ
jgi:hypothetical protein